MLKRLFGWLLSSFRSRTTTSYDLYQPRERYIYSYFDGEKVVRADPQVLYKAVAARGADLDVMRKLARSPSKAAVQGHNDYVKAVREIFGLTTWDGRAGLTEAETSDVLDHFLLYCDHIKKNSRASPTSAAETPAPSAPSSAESPPTPSSSDSGSTGPAPSSAWQGRSPSATGSAPGK